jgi:hypothetical protein
MLRFTLLWVKPKPGNFCLPDWKPNTMSSYSDTTSCNFSPERRGGATSFFNSANKEILSVLSVLVIHWQEMTVSIKKEGLPPFVSVNALLFYMQYGHASFLCIL